MICHDIVIMHLKMQSDKKKVIPSILIKKLITSSNPFFAAIINGVWLKVLTSFINSFVLDKITFKMSGVLNIAE